MTDFTEKYDEIRRHIRKELSVTILLDRQQVIKIVVNDLIEKYKHNVEINRPDWVSAFETVLRYYLDEDEMDRLRNGEEIE